MNVVVEVNQRLPSYHYSFVMAENVKNNLLTEVKQYLRLRKELAETELIIRVTQLISLLTIIVVGLVFLSLSITFFIFSLVFYLSAYIGSVYAFTIGGLIFIILWVLLYLFKKSIIINPIAKFTSKIIR